MSEKTDGSEVGTSDASSLEPATSEQGTELPWNFDNIEDDKNPFSEFSEEHLNKLDEVLSSVEVRELLQQSATPELGLLTMEGLDGAPSTTAVHGSPGSDERPGSEHEDGESLPESVISVVFSDHGYAINPEREPKTKPSTSTSTLPKPTPTAVTIDMGTDDSGTAVGGVAPDGTLLQGDDTPLSDVDISKPASPYSTASPRKSGRAPTRNRYLDNDWDTTGSPYRGKGRGRGGNDSGSDSPFGPRASTRISDQKQRDLAEKILMANRQAMEAEKTTDSATSSPEAKGKGQGLKEAEEAQAESPVGVGRGKGKGKKDKGAGKGKSSQEETTDNKESQKSDESGEEETMDTVESEPESVTKPSKGKKKKSGKKSGKYEQDSDFSESDTKTETKKGKGKKGKKKGKKGAVAKESDSDAVKSGTVKKKGKVKGKEESDEDTKAVKGNKKADDDQEESGVKGKKSKKSETVEDDTDSEDESKPVKGKKSKKTENEEDESEEDTKPVKGKKKKAGLKGKKKLKNKKGKKKTEKEEETDEESEKKDTAEEEPKTTKAKSPKKLSKKERLKKLKEAKAAKKAKLLEKKKEKLKEAKAKKKKGDTDKDTVSEPESSDVSPAKKKKKGVEKVETSRSPMRKAKAIAESKLESPAQKKKKGKAVGKGGNKRKGDNSELDEMASPAKKAKVGKGAATKGKREVSDSEEDVPLKKIKTDLKAAEGKDPAKPTVATKGEDKGKRKPANAAKESKPEQNIFSAMASEMSSTNDSAATDSSKSVKKGSVPVKNDTKKGDVETDVKEKVVEPESGSSEKSAAPVVETDKNSVTKVEDSEKTAAEVDSEIKGEKESEAGSVSIATDSESKDTLKEQDSKDKHSHHHHHHHSHHRRHSHEHRESISSEERRHSSDKKESVSDGHRRDSHEKSDSHRRESKDRRDSHHRRESRDSHDKKDSHERRDSRSSHDKDRRSSSSTKDKKLERKDSRDRRDSGKERDKKGDKVKDRRDSVASSISSTVEDKTGKVAAGTKKAGAKDAKGKPKKAKKEEIPVDSSMIDLFKPDNMPPPAKEEAPETKETIKDVVKESKVKFKDDESKVKFKDDVKSADDKVTNADVVSDTIMDMESETVVTDKENKERKTSTTDSKEDIVGDKGDNQKSDIKSELPSEKTEDSEKEVKNEIISDSALESNDIKKTEELNVVNTESKESETSKVNEEDKKEAPASSVIDTLKDTVIVKVDPASKNEEATDSNLVSAVQSPVKQPVVKVKQKLRMSDFFTDRRLKINDPKPKVKMVEVVVPEVEEEEEEEEEEEHVVVVDEIAAEGERKRSSRNKAVAFAEILKKEKQGSDEEEEDFEDDENDEDFEDPNKLYCICRQPHNQRFMICCDKCEEWFHGKCVGITRARGQKMEDNNEEYVCPQCSEASSQGEISTTEEGDKSMASESGAESADGADRSSLFETLAATEETTDTKPDSTDEEVSSTVKTPVKTPIKSSKSGKEASTDTKAAKQATPSSKQTTPSSKQATPTSKEATPSSKTSEKKKSPLGQIRKKSDTDLSEKRKRTIKMFKEGVDSPSKDKKGVLVSKCVACNVRPMKPGTVYCSSECQAKHSKESVKPVGILKVNYKKDKSKEKKEKHVAVVERGTGKTLTGDKAPTERGLKEWLSQNPTYDILKAHRRPESKQIPSSSEKKSDIKVSKHPHKEDTVDPKAAQKTREAPEPVRLNVRKGLRDALAARVDTAEDLVLSNSEIKGLSLSIEEELYRYFKDTDHKYKAKYRSLIFNIKDAKNHGLFRKILSGRIRPSKLIRMSAEELASKELAQWREQEVKHTIEMIKETELELLKEKDHQLTKKTHKGEVEVEGQGGTDMSALAEEPKKEPLKVETKADLLAELLPDTTEKHGHHLFDANCKICTGKLAPAADTTPSTHTTVVVTETPPKKKEKPEKELSKQERDLQAEEVVKEVLRAIQRAKADAKKEELESQLRSSVTVRSPDSALSSGLDKKAKFTPSGPMLWKGFIYMQDVSKFVTSAYRVTGPAEKLHLPDTITVCGRINPEHVWDYLSKVKQAASRDICVVRFIPGQSEEKAAYINLYSYLNSRSRCGVVEHTAKYIKDFYIVPLASHSKIPDVLLSFDGPGLEENRCHMLLGVIIRNKSSKSSSSLDNPRSSHRHQTSETRALKSALKDPNDSEKTSSSSTPDKSSSTSSTPLTASSSSTPQDKKKSISFDPIVKEYSHVSEQDDAYEPGGDDPLGMNAPYDPEKDASMKPAAKKAPKSDAVSLMIEKIAMSKNPAEATAAMVTALATSSRIGNQRKLLLELTKKVDEQKKLLEQKRLTTKTGDSPKSGSSPKPSGSSKKKTKGVSSKDPRIRAAMAKSAKEAETAAKEAAAAAATSSVPATEAMDVDMRIMPPHMAAARSLGSEGAVPAPTDPRLRAAVLSAPASTVTSIMPPSLSGGATTGVVQEIINVQSGDLSGIQSSHSKGFYVDHDQTLITPSVQVNKSEIQAVIDVPNTIANAAVTTVTDPASNNSDSSNAARGWTEVSQQVEQEKHISIMEMLKEKQASEKVETKIVEIPIENTSDKSNVDQANSDTKGNEIEGASKSGQGYDIVSQLQAEISGKPVETDKEITAKTDEDKSDSQKKTVPNVTSLLKNLASASATQAGQAGLMLPSALRSLFSSLPATSDADQSTEKEVTSKATEEPAPPSVSLPVEAETIPQDVDMRDPAAASRGFPGLDVYGQTNKPGKQAKSAQEEKSEKDKLSKSFMGFDYDSDSSDGSFEGFDDDGTKKLSPRKRKLVAKPRATIEAGVADTDDRQPEVDVDLRTVQVSDNTQIKDVDERFQMPLSSAPSIVPPGTEISASMMDVDHRRPQFPPSGIRLPFVGSNQPPPPGEEWDMSAMSAPPPFPPGMSNQTGSTEDWSQTPPSVAQPPLPSEPPAPKPPEPPVKKPKSLEDKRKDKKPDKEEGNGKSNSGPLTSDQRLQEIVLQIAKGKESRDKSQSGAMGGNGHPRMQYPRPPLLPMPPPIIHPPSSLPPPPMLPPPVLDPLNSTGMISSGWMTGLPPPPLVNTQSAMAPPILPPQMQPGVAMPPPPVGPGLAPPPRPAGPPFPGPSTSKPPSLLDLPTPLMKPPVNKEDFNFDQSEEDFPPPPILQPEFDGRSHGGHSHGRRDQDDGDRRRQDRYRERSGERDYDRHRPRDTRDYHRDRDMRERGRSDRGHGDRGHGDRGHGDRERGRRDSDRDRRHPSNRY